MRKLFFLAATILLTNGVYAKLSTRVQYDTGENTISISIQNNFPHSITLLGQSMRQSKLNVILHTSSLRNTIISDTIRTTEGFMPLDRGDKFVRVFDMDYLKKQCQKSDKPTTIKVVEIEVWIFYSDGEHRRPDIYRKSLCVKIK